MGPVTAQAGRAGITIETMDAPTPTRTTPRCGAETVLTVGVRSCPYLADHGFQDMTVLPGAFFIDFALSAHRERFGDAAITVRNAVFHHPVILFENGDARLSIETTDRETCVEHSFGEQTAGEPSTIPRTPAALLEVHPLESASGEIHSALSVETFQATVRGRSRGEAASMRRSSANGNRYGPVFNFCRRFGDDGDSSTGTDSRPAAGDRERKQVLPSPVARCRDTTVVGLYPRARSDLRPSSIERADIADLPVPDRLWARANAA